MAGAGGFEPSTSRQLSIRGCGWNNYFSERSTRLSYTPIIYYLIFASHYYDTESISFD